MVLSVKTDPETNKPRLVYSEQMSLFGADSFIKPQASPSSQSEGEGAAESSSAEASVSIMNLKHWRSSSSSNQTSDTNSSHLIVVTPTRVVSLPWRFCELKLEAAKCNNSLYPYCVWYNGRCSSVQAAVSMRYATLRSLLRLVFISILTV